MEYKKYQHIEKLGTHEVEGILNGEVHLTYKIDGTNSCVYLKNDELAFGSRNRELSLDQDNQGFVAAAMKNPAFTDALLQLLRAHPNWIVYGEWLIPVNIKRYKADAWRKFYIFDVFDAESLTYLRFDNYIDSVKELGLDYIPEIAVLQNPTEEDVRAYLEKTGEFLIDSGVGEGIVLKNYEYRNPYGRQTWAKILTEDFAAHKRTKRASNAANKNESPVEYGIISTLLTPEHIQKEKQKLVEKYGFWESKFIFELLNRTFLEFYADNWEIILKKFHWPTINFKRLKGYSDEKIKEVLGL